MKHLLNDLSSEEKKRILEQYDNSLIVETSRFKKLLKSSLGNVKPLMERDGDDILRQHMQQTHSPFDDPMDEFPFPKKKKNMAPIKNVFDMETGKFIGTHQYGVGFEPNKIGEEMGYEPHPTSIPDGTRMEKDEFEELMEYDDESNEDEFEYPSAKQFKYLSAEQFKDRIDDFFSNYGDYINPERLKHEVDMLLGFMNDDFEYIGEGNEERVDDDVSYEKKGSPLVTITVDGGDLIKAYLDNDYRYNYGVNSVELGGRFFFDENVYNNFINKN